MRRLEDSNTDPMMIENGDFSTRLGIFADKPGAGKSYTVLCHILSKPYVNECFVEQTRVTSSMGGYMDIFTHTEYDLYLQTNLILVPRGTLKQWEQYIKTMTNHGDREDIVVVNRASAELFGNLKDNKYRIVIMHEATFKHMFQDYRELRGVRFERFIVDEADSIHIPNARMIQASFTWFITATPHYLCQGLSRTTVFRTLFDVRSRLNCELVTVRSEPAFVDLSIQLPSYSTEEVLVETSNLIGDLGSFVSADIMRAINACDNETAIARLGCLTAQNDNGIIAAVTFNITEEINTLRECIPRTPAHAMSALLDRIKSAEEKIVHVQERVKQSDCCPIGLDTIDVKATTMCCQNAFEFSNLMKAIQAQGRCPLCKVALSPEDIVVSCAAPIPSSASSFKYKNKKAAINGVLKNIFVENKHAKVLVFSDFKMAIVYETLSALSLKYEEVKGNVNAVASILKKFDNSELNVLLLNSQHFGAGINLQSATHIVTLHYMVPDRYQQLIGRAQRPVRSQPLSVINIRYNDECDD